VLLIVADDLGWGDVACVNGGLSETPNLDALVATTTCLDHHYSASPVCAPARAALLTGRYPHRTGAIDTLEARGLDRIHLREQTIGDLLGGAGYATGLVGKWHNGAHDPRYHPSRRGFAEFVGFCGGWHDYDDWQLDVGGAHRTADGRHLTDVFTEEAIQFLGRHRHEPFFLSVMYNAPHYPLQPAAEDLAAFVGRDDLSEGVRRIYALVRGLDRGVGRLLDAVDDLGLASSTLVLVTSDNGPQLGGVEGYDTMRFTAGLHGMKGLVYEGGIRLPMLVRWPDGLPGGQRHLDDVVHLTDWLPTLVELTGAPMPALPVDGRSALAVLEGRPADAPPVRCWQWNRYTPNASTNAAVRDGRWKLVRPPVWPTLFPTADDLAADHDSKAHAEGWLVPTTPLPVTVVDDPPDPQLFDLAADPGETTDLASAHPVRVRSMEATLDAWFADVDADRRSLTWE
jgi:arylsulfatase A